MSLPVIILYNNSGSPVTLNQLDVPLLSNGGSVILSDYNNYYEILADKELYSAIGSTTDLTPLYLEINGDPLSIVESLDFFHTLGVKFFEDKRDTKDSVRVATTLPLPSSPTFLNNTITAGSNGYINDAYGLGLGIDGVILSLYDRILVKNEITGLGLKYNGLYYVTQLGNGSLPYKLTRTEDADTSIEVSPSLSVWVEEGLINKDTSWNLTTNELPILLNTTSLLFVKYAGATGSPLDAVDHPKLRNLIHFIDNGPALGFPTNSYRETLPTANPFPTSIIWWESSLMLKKIVEKTIIRNLNKTPSSITWEMYDADGITVIETVSDTFAYSGIFETSRVRTII